MGSSIVMAVKPLPIARWNSAEEFHVRQSHQEQSGGD
jgi:hypothetical protein